MDDADERVNEANDDLEYGGDEVDDFVESVVEGVGECGEQSRDSVLQEAGGSADELFDNALKLSDEAHDLREAFIVDYGLNLLAEVGLEFGGIGFHCLDDSLS